MDPFTFGMVFTGAAGGTLFVLGLLEKSDFPINEGMIRIFMETSKYGAIIWLFNHVFKVFF